MRRIHIFSFFLLFQGAFWDFKAFTNSEYQKIPTQQVRFIMYVFSTLQSKVQSTFPPLYPFLYQISLQLRCALFPMSNLRSGNDVA